MHGPHGGHAVLCGNLHAYATRLYATFHNRLWFYYQDTEVVMLQSMLRPSCNAVVLYRLKS